MHDVQVTNNIWQPARHTYETDYERNARFVVDRFQRATCRMQEAQETAKRSENDQIKHNEVKSRAVMSSCCFQLRP